MKTYLINCSHRTNGYSDTAQKIIMSSAPKGVEFSVDKAIQKNISPCRACDYCAKHRLECVIKDDMQEIYNKLMNTDKLIVISPVYFSSLPSSIKLIIERTQLLYNAGGLELAPKEFGLVLLGGSAPYNSQFSGAIATFTHLLKDINATKKAVLTIPSTDEMNDDFTDDIKDKLRAFTEEFFS